MEQNKHTRQITGHDGVSDEVAIAWSDREDARRIWGIERPNILPVAVVLARAGS